MNSSDHIFSAASVSPVSAAWLEQLFKQMNLRINQLLAYDPDTQVAMQALAGRSIQLEILDRNQQQPLATVYLLPDAQRLHLAASGPATVDVVIRGRPTALLGLLRTTDKQALKPGAVELRGDIHLAQQVQQIARAIRIDWEQFVADYCGDLVAHRLGRTVRDMRSFLQDFRRSVSADISEYLQHEQQLLATPVEIGEFNDAVDQLRNDVDRLSQRLQRLEQQY
ncbi:MAG: SCP2 sterol-binding domain-containing protein, partial [Gammaproteobacteria bacterium]